MMKEKSGSNRKMWMCFCVGKALFVEDRQCDGGQEKPEQTG